MLGWPVYGVRYLAYGLGNLLRRLRRPPEYVTFLIEQAPAELAPPPAPWWQRWLSPPSPTSMQELRRAFRRLAADPRVKGVVFRLTPGVAMSFAGAQSLRAEIERLRAAGKRVVCWAAGYSSVTYYAASAADQILLQPVGSVQPLGRARGFLYLAEALERAGVEAEILQVSPYKSAGDIFTKRQMPAEVREMAGWLLEADFQELVRAVAAGRRLSDRAALQLVDASPYTDQGALE
ncbi:MAG TPA: S49 family peptidase, partial [Candidatus Acidoferrales bacterium]|nr:S49 family peptidase [Candidatus Acidoferrales bacterium]